MEPVDIVLIDEPFQELYRLFALLGLEDDEAIKGI